MGLLSDPIFLMGMGLLGERGQPRGLLTGLQLAQKGQYQNALMNNMQAQQELAQRKDQRVDDQQAALTRLAKASTATPIPGSGPISKNPKPAYALDPMAEDMAIGAPEIMQRIMEAKLIPVPPKVTDDMAEYNQAVKQGYEGSFEDWMIGLRKSGAPSTVVNTGNQMLPTRDEIMREDVLSRAKDARAFNKSVIDAGYSARGDIAELDKALSLLENVKTGPFEESLLQAKKIASKLGMDIDLDSVSDSEQLRVLLGNQIMARVEQTKGAVSEKEMDLFKTYSANYGNTPEGNRKIIQFQKEKALRDVKLMKMVTDMRDQDKTSPEIQRAIMKYLNENDLSDIFTTEVKQPTVDDLLKKYGNG